MISPPQHFERARRNLASGHLLFANNFMEEAGRAAYLAAFHAAQAFTISLTGNEPKTHRGARTEFLRLTRDDRRVEPRFGIFLAKSYEYKTMADYEGSSPIDPEDAAAALATAAEMVDALERVILPV